ncbi:Cleavage and polyadenylation specificity factor subunit 1, partial [Nowakowskiella sp. JEL0078]
MNSKTYPVLFSCDNLPYNCFKLISVPKPVRGILVLSPNAIIHLDQTSIPGVVCAVNAYFGFEQYNISNVAEERPVNKFNKNAPAPVAPPPVIPAPVPVSIGPDSIYSQSRLSDYKCYGISLDDSVQAFINPETLLVVLRGGEMITVQLLDDEDDDKTHGSKGWRRKKAGVKRFVVEFLSIRITNPSCACLISLLPKSLNSAFESKGKKKDIEILEDDNEDIDIGLQGLINYGYLFVGSRTDSSVLMQYIEVENMDFMNEDSNVNLEPQNAIPEVEETLIDPDDLDLYGDDDAKELSVAKSEVTFVKKLLATTLSSTFFKFRLCDVLLSSGPVKDMVLGEPDNPNITVTSFPDMPSMTQGYEYQPSIPRLELELVGCVGEGKSGGIGIFQREIRPRILVSTESEFKDINDCWVVRCKSEKRNLWDVKEPVGDAFYTEYHDYMILSKNSGTVIFKTNEEILEIEKHEFYREAPT